MTYDTMEYCFESLNEKIDYTLNNTNLSDIFNTLLSIKGPTLVCGVGGSSVVAHFLAKVLREKNKIIATFTFPRDLEYMSLQGYENVIAVSYSGNNIGVDEIYKTNLNKYLFTGNPKENTNNMVYTMPKEASYVSIGATFIPLTILYLYYNNNLDIVKQVLDCDITTSSDNTQYEVLYGKETSTAATLLESSIIEAGFGSCVLHEKYNYCHGRINVTRNCNSDLIMYRSNNELDDLLYDNLKKYYTNIITIDRKYDDEVTNDYYSSYISLRLIKAIATNKKTDISDMKELSDNDVLYLFKGKMK